VTSTFRGAAVRSGAVARAARRAREDQGTADTPPRIDALVVDAADPERLAAFWSEVLGRPVMGRTGPCAWLRRENGLGLGFQRTGGPKSGRNRPHFGITSPDPSAGRQRAEALGGRHTAEYDTGGFLVMAGPDGDEFCVIPEGPFELDDEGRAHYLT
jgi:hypothetical protein